MCHCRKDGVAWWGLGLQLRPVTAQSTRRPSSCLVSAQLENFLGSRLRAGEDRETGQNRKAVATEGLGREKSGEHGEEWWRAQATAAARAANTTSSNSFAMSCVQDVWGKNKRERGK
jgi:hypothetical protein